jgi:hypothetical protein
MSGGGRQERLVAAALWALASAACFQSLNTQADQQTLAPPPSGDETAIDISSMPIQLDVNDDSQTTMDSCTKVRQDKTNILTAYCAGCHTGPSAQGLPQFNFVLDDSTLMTAVWNRAGQAPLRFVIPGDPEHSALYIRASTDMPPIPTDLSTARLPSATLSDLSVLREWITHCL